MNIGIDGLLLRPQNAGSLRYFELLLGGLAQAEDEHEFTIFAAADVLNTAALPRQPNIHYQTAARRHFLPGVVQQQAFRRWQANGRLDLLHAPLFAPPLGYSGKTVMTVLDLTFALYPQTQKWTGRLWWKLLGPPGFRKADRLIAISESTKQDLCRLYRLSPERVSVVQLYAPDHFCPAVGSEQAASEKRLITQRYTLPEQYILYTGTLERRKNIATLLHAFDQARRRARLPQRLVLAGKPGWLYEDIYQTVAALDLQQEVVFPGYIAEADLPALYRSADLFVYLSMYEGFGLPVLEAMACGTPVLTSNVSSLPEVAGDAALMVDPEDTEKATWALLRLLTDIELRQDLRARGLQQASRFNRQRFAAETLAVYRSLGTEIQ